MIQVFSVRIVVLILGWSIKSSSVIISINLYKYVGCDIFCANIIDAIAEQNCFKYVLTTLNNLFEKLLILFRI